MSGGWPSHEIELSTSPAEKTYTLELTEKQIEAIQAAAVLGWFDVPKQADSNDLSRELKVANSPATRRIRKGEREIILTVVDAIDDLCPLCYSSTDRLSQHECPGLQEEAQCRPL